MIEDKVTRWILPVDEDEDGFLLTLPDDLLEVMNLVPGDSISWEPQEDGTIMIKRVESNE